jgi:hypothetical protein
MTPITSHRRSAQAAATNRRVEVRQPLAAVVPVAAMVTSTLGLVLDDAYGTDEATVQMLRGFDLVTLAVIGPALLLADRRGSALGRVVVASLLAYLGYTQAYSLLGVGFTDLLLLQAPLFTATLVALVLTLRALPTADLAARTAGQGVRVAAAVLALLAVSLGGMWVYACLAYVVDGTLPVGSSLVESATIVHLGVVLDLTLLVPLYGAAAVLLWRRRAWGFVLAAVALLAGTLHQVSYLVALWFQHAADVPGSVLIDPVEPVILGLYGIATVLLLRQPHAAPDPSTRTRPTGEGDAHTARHHSP